MYGSFILRLSPTRPALFLQPHWTPCLKPKVTRDWTTSYCALLSPVLLAKLPLDLWLVVSRKVSDNDLNMDGLLATFQAKLTARKRSTHTSSISVQRSKFRATTSTTLLPGPQDTKIDPQCCWCQQSHPLVSWTSATNSADCRQVLKTSGRCFNCLRQSHISPTWSPWSYIWD